MIVTTAITAATPTTMPTSVSAVRNLFARKLASATRNASHSAVTRTNDAERFRGEVTFCFDVSGLIVLPPRDDRDLKQKSAGAKTRRLVTGAAIISLAPSL